MELTQTARLRIGLMGDPHYGWSDVDNYFAGDIIKAWMEDDNFPEIDFAINLGDFISGDFYDHFDDLQELWKTAMDDSFGKLAIPWFIAFGNHDVQEGMANVSVAERQSLALQATGTMQPHFAFVWHNVLFIVEGWSRDEQFRLDWYNGLLSQYPNLTTVIVSHTGPREWMTDLVTQHPQISLFIHGHGHNFRHYTFCGRDVFECGHVNDSRSWTGRPWSGYVEITPWSIAGKFYDVKAGKWVTQMGQFRSSIKTTIKPTGLEWYGIPLSPSKEQVDYNNHLLAQEYESQVIGDENINLRTFVRPLLWSRIPFSCSQTEQQGEKVYNCHLEQDSSDQYQNAMLVPLQPGVIVENVNPQTARSGHQVYPILAEENNYTASVEKQEPPAVTISEVIMPDEVRAFDDVVITVKLKNAGGRGTVAVTISVDEVVQTTNLVDLQANSSGFTQFNLEFKRPDEYQVQVASLMPKLLTVTPGTPF